MELVKRNSAEFKAVRDIIIDHENSTSRKRSISLFALRPGDGLEKAVPLKGQADSDVLYDLAYDGLLEYFRFNKSKKLFREKKGFYFFKSDAKSDWIEYPFKLSGKLAREVAE